MKLINAFGGSIVLLYWNIQTNFSWYLGPLVAFYRNNIDRAFKAQEMMILSCYWHYSESSHKGQRPELWKYVYCIMNCMIMYDVYCFEILWFMDSPLGYDRWCIIRNVPVFFFFFFFLVITPMGEITISENGGLWYVPEIRLSDSSFFILLSTISGWCFIEFKFGGSLFGLGPSKGISNPVVNLQPNMGYYHNVSKNILIFQHLLVNFRKGWFMFL